MPVRKDFTPGEFCWIDLNAHDLEAAAAWYGALFGWTHEVAEMPGGGPPYAFLKKDGHVVGGLGQMSDEMKAMGIPPLWNSYVATADCHATEARVKELGGTVTVPTMDVPGHGRLAFFVDPEGASFAAWQATEEDSDGVLVGEHGALSWTELMTRDVAKAREFYGGLFDWTFETMPMGEVPYGMIRVGGKDAGGMFPMTGEMFEGVPAHWMVYLHADDVAATTAKAESSGGTVVMPPTEIPIGMFSVLKDPQGGTFSLVSVKEQAC